MRPPVHGIGAVHQLLVPLRVVLRSTIHGSLGHLLRREVDFDLPAALLAVEPGTGFLRCLHDHCGVMAPILPLGFALFVCSYAAWRRAAGKHAISRWKKGAWEVTQQQAPYVLAKLMLSAMLLWHLSACN